MICLTIFVCTSLGICDTIPCKRGDENWSQEARERGYWGNRGWWRTVIKATDPRKEQYEKKLIWKFLNSVQFLCSQLKEYENVQGVNSNLRND